MADQLEYANGRAKLETIAFSSERVTLRGYSGPVSGSGVIPVTDPVTDVCDVIPFPTSSRYSVPLSVTLQMFPLIDLLRQSFCDRRCHGYGRLSL